MYWIGLTDKVSTVFIFKYRIVVFNCQNNKHRSVISFLYRQEEEGNFTWTDGNKAEFLNFHHKQPDNKGSDDCVYEWDRKWYDSTCNHKKHGNRHLVPLCQMTYKGNYSAADLVIVFSFNICTTFDKYFVFAYACT